MEHCPMMDLSNVRHSQSVCEQMIGTGLKKQFSLAQIQVLKECQCPHNIKIASCGGKYWNCEVCGAFLSASGVEGLTERDRRGRIEISPSLLYEKMVSKQDTNRGLISKMSSTEIEARRKLVDWMCEVGDNIHLSAECVHKSVAYIDVIMNENTVAEEDLQPLALICLLISGKLLEKDHEVGRIVALFRRRMKSEKIDIMKYEMQVMSLLHWDVQCVTPMEFLQLFISQGILFSNDTSLQLKAMDREQQAKSLRQYVEFFADLCLQDHSFNQIRSLDLSAAIIAASRKTLRFKHIWSGELELLTGFSLKDLEPNILHIIQSYQRKNQKGKEVLSFVISLKFYV